MLDVFPKDTRKIPEGCPKDITNTSLDQAISTPKINGPTVFCGQTVMGNIEENVKTNAKRSLDGDGQAIFCIDSIISSGDTSRMFLAKVN